MTAEYGKYIPPDPNITKYNTGHRVQAVTVNEHFVMVEDPQMGDFVITDDTDGGLYYDYLTTANAFRSGGISQLCKDQASSTIPNAASFTRRWHCNGLFGLVEHFGRRYDFEPETKLAYHLATDGDDQGYTFFSHALEQAVQRWGGPENYHETVWPHIAELGGTAQVLKKHGVTVNDDMHLSGVIIPGFIKGSHPEVTLDRFQYGVTEMLGWYDHDDAPEEVRELVRGICSPENLVITQDGNLAFTDQETARIFAKGYLLLSTEHWNDPINRVQLHLLIQATQRAIVKRRISWMDDIDKRQTRRPEDYLYGVDQDIVDAMSTGPGRADDFMYAINNTLHPIAMQERQRFLNYKLREYGAFLLDEKARDYPSEYLEPRRVEFGPPSSQVAVSMSPVQEGVVGTKVPELDASAEGIRYELGPLKNRYVDPLVVTKLGPQRLTALDENYKKLLQEQQHLQQMNTTVELAFAGGFEEVFKSGVRDNDRDFRAIRDRSPMTSDQKRRVIEKAANRAKQMGQAAGTLILKGV